MSQEQDSLVASEQLSSTTDIEQRLLEPLRLLTCRFSNRLQSAAASAFRMLLSSERIEQAWPEYGPQPG